MSARCRRCSAAARPARAGRRRPGRVHRRPRASPAGARQPRRPGSRSTREGGRGLRHRLGPASARVRSGARPQREVLAGRDPATSSRAAASRLREYADLPARSPPPAERSNSARVWNLYREYEPELRSAGVLDFEDVILRAEASLRERRSRRYTAVIVDEAQDLSCAMIRMLHALVGDRPDGLTLIGDGQQTIYPGGYTLTEAGINITAAASCSTSTTATPARSRRSRRRSSRATSSSTSRVARLRGDAAVAVPRTGAAPVVGRWTRSRPSTTQRSWRIRCGRRRSSGVGCGDIGVLCADRTALREALQALRRPGSETVMLTDYDGRGDRRGEGRHDQAREGPRVQAGARRATCAQPLRGDADGIGRTASASAGTTERRELYVAMTRARDGLWVGVV